METPLFHAVLGNKQWRLTLAFESLWKIKFVFAGEGLRAYARPEPVVAETSCVRCYVNGDSSE